MDEMVTVDVAMGRLERLEGFGLAVHPGRCVRVRNRHASCARCAQACTSGALAFRDGALAVNEALCVGCGTCATVCPTCAIEARHPVDAQLLAAGRRALREAQVPGEGTSGAKPAGPDVPKLSRNAQLQPGQPFADGAGRGAFCGESTVANRFSEPSTVTFACHRAFAEAPDACSRAGAIELACLSRMEESLVMRLFADGAQRVRLLHGGCEGCPRENGFASVKLVRDTVANLIEAWSLTCAYVVEQVATEVATAGSDGKHGGDVAKGDAGGSVLAQPSRLGDTTPVPASRVLPLPSVEVAAYAQGAGRQSTAADHGPQAGGRSLRPPVAPARPAHVQADGTLPHFVPLRRHALLDALADLGQPARSTLDTRLWGHITIDMGKCRSCKMCAVFCPTGALQKYVGENGHGGVEHYPAECVHCGLCQDICPAGAIVSSTAVPAQVLVAGETERYPMPDPVWTTGPDQILRKMTPQIHSREVQHSY